MAPSLVVPMRRNHREVSMNHRKTDNRRIVLRGPVPKPPPAGFRSWGEFRAALWNAGLQREGTRVFRIVGDELHEIPVDEAVVVARQEEDDE
jgi:hypothetical protein